MMDWCFCLFGWVTCMATVIQKKDWVFSNRQPFSQSGVICVKMGVLRLQLPHVVVVTMATLDDVAPHSISRHDGLMFLLIWWVTCMATVIHKKDWVFSNRQHFSQSGVICVKMGVLRLKLPHVVVVIMATLDDVAPHSISRHDGLMFLLILVGYLHGNSHP